MPNNWKTYKLGEILEYQKGFAFKSSWYENEGRLIVRVSDTTINSINVSTCNKIDELKASELEKYSLEHKDVVIATVGSWPPNYASVVGKVIKVPNEASGSLLNQNAVRLRVNNSTNQDQSFLYYLMKSPSFMKYIINSAQGSANQASIKLTDIFNYEIQLPPLPEQRAITSILSSLDDKIELNLQTNKTLEEMAMSLYKHWFVDFGPFKVGKFIDSELGQIPEGWEVKSLRGFIDLNPRLSIKKGTEASFVEMKALPTDAMSVSDIAIKEFKGGAKFQNGDTLYARITPCLENGKTAFVDFLEDDNIAFGSTEFLVMRAKEEVSKYWTYCISRDPFFRRFSISTMVGTSGRQRVQNDPFLSYGMAKPPKSIFDSFTEEVEPWFFQIRQNTLENQTLTALRDTLLPKLISGEVRVKDVEQTLSEVL